MGRINRSEDIPITTSDFWQSEDECTLDVLKHVFRSCTDEEMPMLEERLACLREAGQVMYEVGDFRVGVCRRSFAICGGLSHGPFLTVPCSTTIAALSN